MRRLIPDPGRPRARVVAARLALVLAARVLAALAVLLLGACARTPPPASCGGRPAAAAATVVADAAVLTGEVRADGVPVPNATVTLRLFTAVTGASAAQADMVWSVSHATDGAGRFRFGATDLPADDLGNVRGYAASLTATANCYQADSADLLVRRTAAPTAAPVPGAGVPAPAVLAATPQHVLLSLTRLDRGLYVFLLLPGLAGLSLSLLSLAMTRFRWPVVGKTVYRYGEYHPALYALSTGGLWIFAVLRIVQAYVATGQEVVPIGPAGLTIPSSLVVATFLGSLTYVAYTVYVRGSAFFGPDFDGPRRELLLVVGGRVLVAPYVAAIAFGILAPTFPQLATSPFVLFFGFFTGLWIKPVLEALNGIGKRLLSEASQERVAENLLSPERRARVPVTARLLVQAGERVGLSTDRGDLSLTVDRSRLALRLRDAATAAQVATELGLTPVTMELADGFLVFTTGVSDVPGYLRLTAAAAAHPAVVRVGTVFGDGGSQYAFATDRVTLQMKTAAPALPPAVDEVLAAQRGTAARVQGAEYLVRLAPEVDPFVASAALNAVPDVALAEPDLKHAGSTSGTFAVVAVTGCTGDLGLAFQQIRVDAAWQRAGATNAGLVRVAVLDNGVDVAHADIEGAFLAKFDAFAGEGKPFPLAHDRHGSGCAGLAVAAPAQKGMKGVGFGAKLLAARVGLASVPGAEPLMAASDIRFGLQWARAQGADVISMSISLKSGSVALDNEIASAAREGRGGRGCILVAAAGNDGGPVAYPARLDAVLAVAATDIDRTLKRGPDWSSNFGPEIDIAAPGTPSFTTALRGTYQCLNGTSAATAMVAGAAALVLRMNPALTAKEVRDLLIASSQLLPAGSAKPGATIKLLDVEAAVRAASH